METGPGWESMKCSHTKSTSWAMGVWGRMCSSPPVSCFLLKGFAFLRYLPLSTPALLQLIVYLADDITWNNQISSIPCLKTSNGFLTTAFKALCGLALLSCWPHLLALSDLPNLFGFSCLVADIWMYSLLPPRDLCTDCSSTWQGSIFIQIFGWRATSPHSGLCSNNSSSERSFPNH